MNSSIFFYSFLVSRRKIHGYQLSGFGLLRFRAQRTLENQHPTFVFAPFIFIPSPFRFFLDFSTMPNLFENELY
ncbi:hypothetical protein RCL_jg15139.t1 [Rhizophagus clarus]|uniref:Uncharacterized protein n=1 Tax=Rhizophagus clarus TaxID=94130 RepID=A0A8H3L312_9GLOM|nr:hypothetical protein RCL_jg15139.t1 [Rhizophagus clarus]